MIYIPASIKDPALRRTLEQIAQEAGGGSGSVSVQEMDPTGSNAPPGSSGDIIYVTGTNSIWVFSETSWTRASSGTSALNVVIEPYEANSAFEGSQLDPAQLTPGDAQIKNNNGSIGLLVRVYSGASEWSTAEYSEATYNWRKSGSMQQTYNRTGLSGIQGSGTGTTSRKLIINADDITDAGTDAFFCEVTFDT